MSIHRQSLDNVYEVYDEALEFPCLYNSAGERLILVSRGKEGWDDKKQGCSYGWSSICNRANSQQMLMDARIIRFFCNNFVMTGRQGGEDLTVEECEPLTSFLKTVGIVNEYVGSAPSLLLMSVPHEQEFDLINFEGAELVVF